MTNTRDATDNGFKLYYEDFDRPGTAGVSIKLNATNIDEAVTEACHYLKNHPRLPQQNEVTITHSFSIDVSDLNLGT